MNDSATLMRYRKERCTQLNILLHNENDADIIQQLDIQKSKQGYIKQLIRQDIRKEHD